MNPTYNKDENGPGSNCHLIETILVSPGRHQKVTVISNKIKEIDSERSWDFRDGVALMLGEPKRSYFDDKFQVMQRGHENDGEWQFCYAKQVELFQQSLKPDQLIVDIGCGPWLPYDAPPGATVVGLEPSFDSLRANRQLDIRIMGSAQDIPLPNRSVDVIVCFYSIHHMVGDSIGATRDNVATSFKEFGRVLKKGGTLFVFEMTPFAVFDLVQRLSWNPLRKAAPHLLDMLFWRQEAIVNFVSGSHPDLQTLEVISFPASPFVVFSPAFSLPWLKVPRFLYPLKPILYRCINSDK